MKLLLFYVGGLSTDKNVVMKSLIIILVESISPVRSNNIYFMYLVVLFGVHI
jgi:hypothetical protein